MTREQRERLSSLVDDELDSVALDDALCELSRDEELRGLWMRYHVIGEVLRGEPTTCGAIAVGDRVRERLVDPPLVLRTRPRAAVPRWLRQTGVWTLAASVALVAILGGSILFRDTTSAPPVRMARQEGPPPIPYRERSGIRWGVQRPEVESKLDSFLVTHQGYSPVAGFKGMVPYATFASYGTER